MEVISKDQVLLSRAIGICVDQGQKCLTLAGADNLFYCSVWVICTSRSGITPPKIANFSIFIPSDQKILGSKPDWTLIYCGLEV